VVIARDVSQQVTAINFVFDTLLFAGTLLVISRAIPATTDVNRVAHADVASELASRQQSTG
jgi:hypothetical protein